MRYGKPVIGIAGGIGSGKSFVAAEFGRQGGLVIDADAQVRRAYADGAVVDRLRQWWGDRCFKPDGTVDRRWLADRVFNDPADKRRLEGLIHPWVAADREAIMAAAGVQTRAFIWDIPLLFETGLNGQCDATVFVDCPREIRLRRVQERRRWTEAELTRRENLQMPLDNKRRMADYVLVNTAGESESREQVRTIFTRILDRLKVG